MILLVTDALHQNMAIQQYRSYIYIYIRREKYLIRRIYFVHLIRLIRKSNIFFAEKNASDIIILDPDYEPKNAQNDGNVQPIDETISNAMTDSEADDTGDSDEYGTTSEEKIMALLPAFKEEFREAIESLATLKSSDNETRCEMMQRLMLCIYENVS